MIHKYILFFSICLCIFSGNEAHARPSLDEYIAVANQNRIWGLPEGVALGSTQSMVRAALGEPTLVESEGPGILKFSYQSSKNHCLRYMILFHNGNVGAIVKYTNDFVYSHVPDAWLSTSRSHKRLRLANGSLFYVRPSAVDGCGHTEVGLLV